ncbi:MAG: AEC family transporter, partial [Lachnospiraceae bacterium]|nr:AEC family transporter [Lachnospiraceae bacterium]
MALIVMQRISTMFIIIVVGVICSRTKLVSKKGGKDLSNILMYVVNPMLLLFAFQKKYSIEALQGFFVTFAISMIAIAISIGAANILIRRDSDDRPLEKYALVYTNCGFFGIPIINSIYGM